ncbi:FkbM family methyltransferase [Prochlorococcus sp. MIT 1223]|uniref:FkbM family methyltransferase n=1 Tax=Prochlorococcus sp. MIT 1223 TaxID=3096217 RepID=UPI002A755F53|nr:FkbM family methyltransferase [Prochlorococcus sp. MIT 1223]
MPNVLISKIIGRLKRKWARVTDKRLSKTKAVLSKDNRKLFEIYDYGEICRFRASSFLFKEPETIDWIDSFDSEDIFLDIGANIGIYSLYAATKGIQTICIEPDALNFALLNMNIRINKLGNLVKAFLIALHDKKGFSELNLQKMQWGGALSSFDNQEDQFENVFKPAYSQGCFGDTLDNCISELAPNVNHIKIDVDGNENRILRGASKTLMMGTFKSLLIELDETRSDYQSSILMIEDCGFNLVKKTHSALCDDSKFSTTYNHIFRK